MVVGKNLHKLGRTRMPKERSQPAHRKKFGLLEKHKDYVYRVNYNSTGDRLLSCGYGGHIVLWNGTSGEPLFEHEFNRVSNFADMAPDGSRIFVAGGEGTGRFVDVPPDSR